MFDDLSKIENDVINQLSARSLTWETEVDLKCQKWSAKSEHVLKWVNCTCAETTEGFSFEFKMFQGHFAPWVKVPS